MESAVETVGAVPNGGCSYENERGVVDRMLHGEEENERYGGS